MKTIVAIGLLVILVIILSESENRKTRMEKRKRPVKVKHDRLKDVTWDGIFHQFGTATSLGQPSVTVAIVEDEIGKVHKVDPERIQFADK